MDIQTRLLEEWKANSELLKFYDDLKQERFAHFLTRSDGSCSALRLLTHGDRFVTLAA